MMKKMVIFHFGALGDLLLSRPALLSLRQRYPEADIDFAGRPSFWPLIKDEMRLRQFYDVETVLFRLFQGEYPFDEHYSLAVIFAKSLPSTWKQALKPTKVIWIKTIPETRMPVWRYQWQQIRSQNEVELPFKPLNPSIEVKEHFELLIHAGSGSIFKNWPPDYFARVIEHFKGRQMGLIWGPADDAVSYKVLEHLKQNQVSIRVLKGCDLVHLTAIIKSCRVYLGNDSGITQLAAATGVPTLAIFGPTDPVIWQPWGQKVEIYYANVSCSPCDEVKRQTCVNRRCLKAISPQRVIKDLEAILRQ